MYQLKAASGGGSDFARGCGSKDAAELWALHVAGGGTGGGVAEAVAQGGKTAYGPVEFIGLRGELLAVDAGAAVGGEHLCDLVEGEAGGSADGDEGEALEDVGVVLAAESVPSGGTDEALLLVIAQGGGGQSGGFRDFSDVEQFHS